MMKNLKMPIQWWHFWAFAYVNGHEMKQIAFGLGSKSKRDPSLKGNICPSVEFSSLFSKGPWWWWWWGLNQGYYLHFMVPFAWSPAPKDFLRICDSKLPVKSSDFSLKRTTPGRLARSWLHDCKEFRV
jgi:hypothetical protein